ncbi:MAG: carboxypeptidase regulatory-like domain-containing protein [Polyangiaceae bacterium]|nr:carboxypeptidase regulatory-like domain-containing protein [Polyangiaceae bacterium]
MRRLLCVALWLVLSLVAGPGRAQDASAQGLPEEHPPLPQRPDETSVDAEAQPGGPGLLPPGHPPVDQAGGSLTGGSEGDPDSAKADPTLPAGTVLVQVLDAQGHGIPNLRVQLEVTQGVPAADSRTGRTAPTGEDGSVRFDNLPGGAADRLRARTTRDSATFASPAFTVGHSAGTRVRLHVYPVTRDAAAARVGSVAKVFVLPQERAFVIEALFSIANFGAAAWVPAAVRIELPSEAVAFDTPEATDSLTIVHNKHDGARLQGTVGPGVHSVVFRFQVPRHDGREHELTLGMPPRLVQATVVAESAPGMTLAVRGLPPATGERSDDGRRVLMTSARIAGSGESLPNVLEITMGGLPVPGPGRWVVLVAAMGFVVGGVAARGRAAGARTAAMGAAHAEQIEAARWLILRELGNLEGAHRDGQVGPRTYEQARRELVDALARLEPVVALSTPRSAAR